MNQLNLRFLWRGLAVGLLLATQTILIAPSAGAEGVAMVTDLSGRVAGLGPVAILSEVPADARVQVEAGAQLVVIYLQSGDEYTFSGPSQIQFRASEPQVMSGAQPQKRSSPLAKGGKLMIKPVAVRPGAFVMRGARPSARIKLLTLSGTKTLETALEFQWQEIEPGARYRLEITDDTGKSLHASEVQGTSATLPASVQLREGITYTWEVSTRVPDGRRYLSAGDFSLAAAQLRAEANSLRPAASAPVSERVAYAAWLEQMELKDEARKYWKALAAERPEDARLRSLATE